MMESIMVDLRWEMPVVNLEVSMTGDPRALQHWAEGLVVEVLRLPVIVVNWGWWPQAPAEDALMKQEVMLALK